MQTAYVYDDAPLCASQFTGKERDAETGLDYFGARYYGSNMGRWMSPDWSAAAVPVPYADMTDPQSLNLYGYVRNNPIVKVDLDGHDCPTCPTVPIETPTAADWELIDAAGKGGVGGGLLMTVGSGVFIGGAVHLYIYSVASRNFAEADLKMQEQKAINDLYLLADRKRGNRKGDDFAHTSDRELWEIYRGNKKDPRWLRAKEELKARGLLGKGSDGDKKKPPKPPKPPAPPPDEPTPDKPNPDPPKPA